MEENRLFTNSHALDAETEWNSVNRLKGFIFPVEYSG